MKLIDFAARQR